MYLAVDGGATKTIAIAVSPDDFTVKGIGISGPSNLRSVTPEIAAENIHKAMETALKGIGRESVTASIFGLAGFGDSEQSTRRVNDIVKEAGDGMSSVATNDGQIASFLVTMGGNGMIVAPGTGSVGSYILDDKVGRVGGWSYLTGDSGSAFWITRKGLEMAEKSYDGLLERTRLVDEYESAFNINLRDVVADLEENFDKRKIASLAPIVDRLAKEGDRLAQRVMEMAVEEIDLMLGGMKKHFSSSYVTGCAGGVIRSTVIQKMLKQRHRDIQLFYGYHIVAGGILKLLNDKGISADLASVRNNLVEGIDHKLMEYDPEEKAKFLFI